MKNILLAMAFFHISIFNVFAAEKGNFPSGIVYGPKAAFQIYVPKGWLLDNDSGSRQGLACILYVEGKTWRKSPAIMLVRMAPPGYSEKDAFIKFAVSQIKKEDSSFSHRKIKEGKTDKGYPFTIKEYFQPGHEHFKRIAYVQLPDTVAYIVYQSLTEKDYKEHLNSLDFVLKTLEYRQE